MIKSKIVLISALVSCALISGCKEDKANVTIEFMHSSVEQERQAIISKLITRFEKENPGISVKQVPVEEDAYNTKVITLSRSGSLPEVIETSHDYAKVMDKEQLLDRKAIENVIRAVGEQQFYDGVLRIVRTEDGTAWTGVPVSAWIGGIWYRKDVLANAGLAEPNNWAQLLEVAQKLNDPAHKKYGIALPTAESVLTEQSFSQFALSNQANVFNAEGHITLNTPEMAQALTYYRALAANTMPGSNDIMEVKDAFMNGTAPMAIYSTYILPAVIKEGWANNVGFVVPTEKTSAVYGMLTSLTITSGQESAETQAAEKFVTFMEQAENIADWVMMSPGAALPVNKAVVTTATWQQNDVIKALGTLPNQLIAELPNIQVFGAVGDKNFTRMGDVTGSGVVSSMVHNVTVGKADLDKTIAASQKKLDE
ncbi:MAG: ABC transporter substrate-binding protein, partial [Kluyvera sp.]